VIYGETGAGKELVARAVHQMSPRRSRPMISINCAAIPEHLAEAELFGHELGSFTGAVAARTGLLEAASGGTIFLDEIGELPLTTQARLLRAIDNQRITRVGATDERTIDVRVIAATHRDLHADMCEGRFREDLYFRLGGASVTVPPLRARTRDLPHLAADLLAAACARLARAPATLASATLACLARHRWPGNVRELRHAMDFAAATAPGDTIDIEHLPPGVTDTSEFVTHLVPDAPATLPPRFLPIADELRALERLRMSQALESTNGNQSRAAALLSMPRRTFLLKMKAYQLDSAAHRRR
jgi:DNA-binding NtrC family response regulator